MKTRSIQGGFFQIIILIIILLVLLGYFGINIEEIVASPVARANLHYFLELKSDLWTNYLQGPVMWLWNNIGKDILEILLQSIRTVVSK